MIEMSDTEPKTYTGFEITIKEVTFIGDKGKILKGWEAKDTAGNVSVAQTVEMALSKVRKLFWDSFYHYDDEKY